MPECLFAHLGGCQGRLVKAHLISAQRIRRELRSQGNRDRRPIVWDERVWTFMCGGPVGLSGHHGAFDAKQIEIARDDLPGGVEEFAREYGLAWSLEADYGLPSDFVAP